MNGTMQRMIGIALTMQATMEVNQKEWQERIRAQWEESKNFPSKKKKRVRKELLLEWSIACYDPFEGMYKL